MKPTRAGATRDRAEAAFHRFLELVQAGTAPEPEAFVLQQDAALHAELREMLSDWQALRGRLGAQPRVEAGQVVGDFVLVRELGRGGMGVVWEALQPSLDRRVALKLLAVHTAFSPSSLQRFQREALAAGRLEHPGIVRVYEVGEAGGVHFIAQELIEDGSTLEDLLAEQRAQLELPADWYRRMAELFAAAAEALQHAHLRGVIHRDVKPSNLLLGPGGAPKLADFGLAKVLDRPSLSRTLELAGTPYYMSPEQAAAKSMGIDARTDVFSLGATLYEALTLRRPFEGDTLEQIFRQILTVDPPEPRTLRSRVPRELAIVCLKAIEKDRERRYASAEELAADLRRWLRNEPILARPPGPFARAGKWTKRHPVVATGGAVALVALTVITTLLIEVSAQRDAKDVALGARDEALKEKDVALGARESALAEKDKALGARERLLLRTDAFRLAGIARRVAQREPGEALALAIDAAVRDPGIVQYDALLEILAVPIEDRVLAGHTGAIDWGQWSADGRRVLTLSNSNSSGDNTCRVWDVATRASRVFEAISASFDATGRRLAVASPDGSAAVFDVESGERLVEFFRLDAHVVTVAFAPVGDRVLSAIVDDARDPRGASRSTPCVWNAETGELEFDFPVTEVCYKSGKPAWSSDGHLVLFAYAREPAVTEGQVWSLDGPERIAVFPGDAIGCMDVGFGANAACVWTPGWDGDRNDVIRLWETSTGRLLLERPDELDQSWIGPLSPDSRRLLTSPDDRTLCIWDVATGALLAECRGAEDGIKSAAISPNGELVAAVCRDATRLWSARDGGELAALPGPAGDVLFSPDGSRLLTTSRNSTARIWNVPPAPAVVRVASPLRTTRRIAFCNQRGWIVTTDNWGVAEVRRASDGSLIRELVREMDGEETGGARVLVSPDERLLVTRVGLSRPSLWDLETGAAVLQPDLDPDSSRDALFSADGKLLVIAYEKSIDVWDMEDRRRRAHRSVADLAYAEGGQARALALSSDGQRVAWASRGALLLWEIPADEAKTAFTEDSSNVTSLCFSPSGARLLVTLQARGTQVSLTPDEPKSLLKRGVALSAEWGPDGGTGSIESSLGAARILDGTSGEVLLSLDGHTNTIRFGAFSPGEDLALTVAGDSAYLWELPSGAPKYVLHGHGSEMMLARFLEGGARLLTVAEDGLATLWNTATGAELFSMHVGAGNVDAADVSADGRRIAVVGDLGRLFIQPVDPLAAARTQQPRALTPWDRGEHRVLGIEALTILSKVEDPLETDAALADVRAAFEDDLLDRQVASDMVQVLRLALERDSGARAAELHELVALAFSKSGETDAYVTHLHALRPTLREEPETALAELERALSLCSEDDIDLRARIWKDQGLILSRHPEAREALNPSDPAAEAR